MNRQLDPRLFGDSITRDSAGKDEDLLPQLDRLPQDPTQLRAQLKKKENIEMKMEAFMSKMNEQQRLVGIEVQKLEKRLERIEQHYKNAHESLILKMQNTDRKITERSVMESKVQALMERQNMMIQNFERKLNLMKKSLEEKEISNLKLTASLREAQTKLNRR